MSYLNEAPALRLLEQRPILIADGDGDSRLSVDSRGSLNPESLLYPVDVRPRTPVIYRNLMRHNFRMVEPPPALHNFLLPSVR